MQSPEPIREERNKTSTRKNWDQIEQHLTQIEKAHGFARAWELREQLEQGKITLEELKRR